MTDITITRDDAASRYEIRSDGALAGFAEYARHGGRAHFVRTEVDPEFRGQGLAGRLAQYALTDAVANGDVLVPECSYIARYLRTHDLPGARIEWPDAAST